MTQTRADNGKRIIAMILDILVGVVIFVVFIVVSVIVRMIPGLSWLAVIVTYLGWLCYLGYFAFRDALPIGDLNGASIGKRLMGMKAVQVGGQNCTYENSIKRNAPFFAPGLVSIVFNWIPILGFIVSVLVGIVGFIFACVELYKVFTDPLGRRIGDLFADTVVVETAAKPSASAPPPPAPPADAQGSAAPPPPPPPPA